MVIFQGLDNMVSLYSTTSAILIFVNDTTISLFAMVNCQWSVFGSQWTVILRSVVDIK